MVFLRGFPVFDVQKTVFPTGLIDRGIDVKFLLAGLQLCREIAQDPEGHLELARVKCIVLAEIPETSAPGCDDGRAPAAGARPRSGCVSALAGSTRHPLKSLRLIPPRQGFCQHGIGFFQHFCPFLREQLCLWHIPEIVFEGQIKQIIFRLIL